MIRFGVIGAGRMGNAHAQEIAALGERARVSRVYDIRPEAAAEMSRKFGAAVAGSAAELADSPDVDCVLIASPTYCHAEVIRAAHRAHKAIFCEKALCRDWTTAQQLREELQGYDRLFTCGFVRRHMPKVQKARELIAAGVLGQLRYCNVDLPLGIFKRLPGDWFTDFELSGGVIVDMLAHHVDLANLFFGRASRVYADGLLLDPAQPLPADYVASVVTYDNGVICNLNCSWWRFGRTGERMEIVGDLGCILLDGEDELLLQYRDGEPHRVAVGGTAAEKALEEVNIGNALARQMTALVTALEKGGTQAAPLPTLADGCNSLEVALAMIESVRTRQAVTL